MSQPDELVLTSAFAKWIASESAILPISQNTSHFSVYKDKRK